MFRTFLAVTALGALPIAQTGADFPSAASSSAPTQTAVTQQGTGVQSAKKPLTFDAASVKPAAAPAGVIVEDDKRSVSKGSGIRIPANSGGPGTNDPGRIHWPLITLKELLRRAWDSYYEIDGPSWLDSQTVAVDATMPPDTTEAQFQEMLRNLITVRFSLRYHAEKKEIAGFVLAIARNGPKLKTAADQGDAALAPHVRPTGRDKEGFPILPPVAGRMMVTFGRGDGFRIVAQQEPILELARSLGWQMKTIVTDATGLTAKYDFTLTFASPQPLSQPAQTPETLEPLPDLFAALQSQLGLKLERQPQPVEVFVVDHMEKTPAGN